jgi:hypothetical protein
MLDLEIYSPYMIALCVELFFYVFVSSAILVVGGLTIETITKRLARNSRKTSVSSRRP